MEKEAAIAATFPVEELEPRRDVTVWGTYVRGYAGIEVYVVKRGWD